MVNPSDGASGLARQSDLSDQSLSELLSRLSQDTSELLSAQVELTKAEVKEEVQKATRVGIVFGTAALLGFLALLLLTFAAAWGLSELVPEGVAFLIVGLVLAGVAAVAYAIGRNTVKQTDFVPNQTVETVKEGRAMGQTTDELRQDITERREEISRDLDAIGDKVSPRQVARRRTESARQRMHDIRDTVMGTASEGASSLTDAASTARDQIQQVPDMARRQTEGNPLAVGLVAFGGGLLLASIIKPSQSEQQLASAVQPGLEQAASELRHTGEELAQDLKEPAREAVESAGQTAREAAQSVASGSSSSGDNST